MKIYHRIIFLHVLNLKHVEKNVAPKESFVDQIVRIVLFTPVLQDRSFVDRHWFFHHQRERDHKQFVVEFLFSIYFENHLIVVQFDVHSFVEDRIQIRNHYFHRFQDRNPNEKFKKNFDSIRKITSNHNVCGHSIRRRRKQNDSEITKGILDNGTIKFRSTSTSHVMKDFEMT